MKKPTKLLTGMVFALCFIAMVALQAWGGHGGMSTHMRPTTGPSKHHPTGPVTHHYLLIDGASHYLLIDGATHKLRIDGV